MTLKSGFLSLKIFFRDHYGAFSITATVIIEKCQASDRDIVDPETDFKILVLSRVTGFVEQRGQLIMQGDHGKRVGKIVDDYIDGF